MTDPDCVRWQLLVQADHDGELGVAEAAAVVAHLDGCADCRAVPGELAAIAGAVRAGADRHSAPAALRSALARQAGTQVLPWRPHRARTALAAGVALAMAACIALVLLPHAPPATDAAVASHIRALQPGHLTDVLSSDQHTVKPWFSGKLDYAPPVRDFATSGFPLLGGRLDYLEQRTVAALVYGRGGHVIDVYVWPDGSGGTGTRRVSGFNVATWAIGGMQFVAVSDLNTIELQDFTALWRDTPP